MTEPVNPAPLPAVVAPMANAPSVFDSMQAFEDAQRVARAIASSALVPQQYRGPEGVPNVLIALDMARRMRAPILAVLQNLNVIHGRPSWSATFIISAISECGLFSPLRFDFNGEGDARTCQAYATELATGEVLRGPRVSIAMAKAEGWYGRAGSKWPTMPDVMLTYRAASFFGRVYAASILAGFSSADEAEDAAPARGPASVVSINAAGNGTPADVAAINEQARRPRGRPRNPPPVDVTPSPATPPPDAAPSTSPPDAGRPLDPAAYGEAIIVHDDPAAPGGPSGDPDLF